MKQLQLLFFCVLWLRVTAPNAKATAGERVHWGDGGAEASVFGLASKCERRTPNLRGLWQRILSNKNRVPKGPLQVQRDRCKDSFPLGALDRGKIPSLVSLNACPDFASYSQGALKSPNLRFLDSKRVLSLRGRGARIVTARKA